MALPILWLAIGFLRLVAGEVEYLYNSANYPDLPDYGPLPNPAYMVDHQHNYFKSAPDKGIENGAAYEQSGSFENFMMSLANGTLPISSGLEATGNSTEEESSMSIMATSGYWLPQLAPKGVQPTAGGDYKFFRNVLDYGADNSGGSDTAEAINAAVEDGKRCGMECGNTFSQGAIVYFPPGTYKICSPVIQLYYTQFIGDALNPPTIKGCDEFVGIALFDTDPYIPGGHGQNWYINQNQFFRQIRNFVFDMTEMPLKTDEHDQPLVPTGLHWQVSQACSLQNLVFNMPKATSSGDKVTHVGIFMENGSGGFVSDLTFNGGNIGWRAGSQQYTAMNLQFSGCLTAVQMVWDWGFNWQRVTIEGSAIAFNISGQGGDTGQGIGSVSIIDSKISNTPIAVLTRSKTSGINGTPNIVLDNLELSGVEAAVKDDDGNVILGAAGKIELWASGRRYDGYDGSSQSGAVSVPPKSSRLLDSDGKLFYRARPQYELFSLDQFLVATDNGCSNDGTGDNTAAINSFLQSAKDAGKIAYFPAGIYRVGGTVTIPTGSRVQGASWSQIQGAGVYFSDIRKPQVVVKVGNRGDVGTMEIVDMMFNVQGATAGAIVLEWNVHQVSQGSAAMWDSHVRVGGATGTDLDIASCPKFSFNENCVCAALLFHVTAQASGYFENVWICDNDMSVYSSPDKIVNQISIYAARGTLIESKGPSWFYGTGSEHTMFYQYQLYGAKDIYLGHIQTETPYFQPSPISPGPFKSAKPFPGDPSFDHCDSDGGCAAAWGLRIINSEGITVHSAGLYSFFQEYYQDCIEPRECQKSVVEVKGSKDVILFNTFTIGITEIANGIDGGSIGFEGNINGYTTEISVWAPLPGDDEQNIVYVGPEVFDKPQVQCSPPCLLVFPTSPLAQPTTIEPGLYTTSLEYGSSGTTTINGQVVTTFLTTTTTITVTVPPVTTDAIPFSNVNVTRSQTSSNIVMSTSIDLPTIPFVLPGASGSSTTRFLTLPPWPGLFNGPPGGSNNPSETGQQNSGVFQTSFVTTVTATAATVTTIQLPANVSPIVYSCPPDTTIAFNTPRTTITTTCNSAETKTLAFTCPPTRIATFLGPSTGVFTVDCTLVTSFPVVTGGPVIPGDPDPDDEPTTTPTTTPTLPVWTTWPGELVPVETGVPEGEDDDDDDDGFGIITPCKLWFFSFCIKADIRISGWLWSFPPGIYPPKPPRIRWPPGWKLDLGEVPGPWPPITIGWDHKITYASEPAESCTTKTAELCSTTSVITRTSTGGSVITTGISTSSRCETLTGCTVSGADTTEVSTTDLSCPTQPARARRFDPTGPVVIAAAQPTALDGDAPLVPRQAQSCGALAAVFPRDSKDVGEIPKLLERYTGKYETIESKEYGFTSLFWVPDLDPLTMSNLTNSNDVGFAYYVHEWSAQYGIESNQYFEPEAAVNVKRADDPLAKTPSNDLRPDQEDAYSYEDADHTSPSGMPRPVALNESDALPFESPLLHERAWVNPKVTWEMSQVSHPKGFEWGEAGELGGGSGVDGDWHFSHDNDIGADQWIYVIGEKAASPWVSHNEIPAGQLTFIPSNIQPEPAEQGKNGPPHGTAVISKIFGTTLGVCKRCNVVYVPAILPPGTQPGEEFDFYSSLNSMVSLLNGIPLNRKGKVTLNFSFSARPLPVLYWRNYREAIEKLEEKFDAVIVISSGNHADTEKVSVSRFPARLGGPHGQSAGLVNAIVVSNSAKDTTRSKNAQYSSWVTTFAPGEQVTVPNNPWSNRDATRKKTGTSLSAPTVAGVVAYLRSLNSPYKKELEKPAAVKKLIKLLHRRIPLKDKPAGYSLLERRPIIWNGQVGKLNCLTDYAAIAAQYPDACPKFAGSIMDTPLTGETTDTCQPQGSNVIKARDGGTCPVLPGDNDTGNGGSSGGSGRTITFASGPTATPTCQDPNGCGGKLCTGYYCSPQPTGIPPDFQDPSDPSGSAQVPDTTIPGPGGPSGGPAPTTFDPSNLPTLTAAPTGAPIPTNCGSVTTWSTCALGVPPGVSACQTFSSCVSTNEPFDPSNLPTLTAAPTGAPIPTDCASVSTWTTCALGLPPGMSACQTFSSCASTSPAPSPTQTEDPIPTGPATFYLYTESWTNVDSDGGMMALAVDPHAKGFNEHPGTNDLDHCNAIDTSPRLYGDDHRRIKGDPPYYPWPYKSFSTDRELCGKMLSFTQKANSGDYEVFDNGKQVGVCVDSKLELVYSCFNWISTEYARVYACTGAC